MTNVKQFLTENREAVINFYNENEKISRMYNVTLSAFMVDLMNNFRKITIVEIKGFTNTDLMLNLKEAVSRLGGNVDFGKVEYSTPYAQSNHAKMVNYHGKEKANKLINL